MGIDGIQLVSIELSNRCPFAEMGMHPKCPAALMGPPTRPYKSLPTSMILSILDDLGSLGYAGLIMFSIYNEPMNDPRFFWLVDQLYARVPKARLRLLMNSLSMNRALVEDLKRYDCACEIDAYTKGELARMQLEGIDYYMVCSRHHDNRLDLYDRSPHGRTDLTPCTAWNHLAIFHTGEICICCMDWARKEVLDDLRQIKLRDFLNGPIWNDSARRLRAGERPRDLCKRCPWEPGRVV
jgi:hypothetical protein